MKKPEHAADTEAKADNSPLASAPAISLPKGGGAIRGIGEKFAANPVTGTGSMMVPLAVSPGRSGFGPQLTLSYDSGSGNGPFGMGWQLSLPSITRKTDKGLPKYEDAAESDVFILSGAEDLVPVLESKSYEWELKSPLTRTVGSETYVVEHYRPRIEGLFARIEKWTNQAARADTFWRSISKDNITTWYGRIPETRIADPADPTRIFSWLISESYDGKGNVIVYRYKQEDSVGVSLDQANESNRVRTANCYLKRIRYGNREPYYPVLSAGSTWPAPAGADTNDGSNDWLFEVVLDYGEHDGSAPTTAAESNWAVRNDPFSSYRSGFEVRTYRLCHRVLLFHHFPDETEVGANCLVRSTDCTYSCDNDPADARNPIYSFLVSVTQKGYRRDGDGGYIGKALPPLEFTYSKPAIDQTVHGLSAESLVNLPLGIDNATYHWVDLDGEGVSGILTEQGGGWFYKRNLSPLPIDENSDQPCQARFGPMELVATRPALSLSGGRAQFMDLAGDGQPDLVTFEGGAPGFFERAENGEWQPFRPFSSWPNLNTHDPNLRFVDLNGDGHADILITENEVFRWHPSLAEDGFGPSEVAPKSRDEETGPSLVLADGTQCIYLADFSGDGLSDLVRIRNGEVCYWPNLGYGRFGAKVTMDNSPSFDTPDLFDQKRVRLADVDGSGTTDIIYIRHDRVSVYFNQSGNSWSQPETVPFPQSDNLSSVSVLDLLGAGTACLVWSSALPDDSRSPLRYIDLMAGQKPHLLIKAVNNLGAETVVSYAPSTRFYLKDQAEGNPWVTKLPFPVHVVERVETYDRISRNRFVTRYSYHHGYFDGVEREFRGFGMVEQRDTEEIGAVAQAADGEETVNWDAASYMPPVLTKTWFHNGAWSDGEFISTHLAHEYFGAPQQKDPDFQKKFVDFRAQLLPDTVLPGDVHLPDDSRQSYPFTTDEQREAVRALKGNILRQEVYAEDGTAKAPFPYSVSERNYTIECLQPQNSARHAVFFAHPRETRDYYYERNLDPVHGLDPRVSHTAVLQVDSFGNVSQSLAVAYARRPCFALEPEQKAPLLTLIENTVANRPNELDWYRTGVSVESLTYEVTRQARSDESVPCSFADLQTLASGAAPIPYESTPDFLTPQKRLVDHTRTLYCKNDLSEVLALNEIDSLALPYQAYKLAFTAAFAKQTFVTGNANPGKPSEAGLAQILSAESGYVHWQGDANSQPDDHWWIPSGRVFLSPIAEPVPEGLIGDPEYAGEHFYIPQAFADPWGNLTQVTYDDYDLLLVRTRDALENVVTVETSDDQGNQKRCLDYSVLQPYWVTDPNGNRTRVAFDALGLVAGIAVMGKANEPDGIPKGDTLEGFSADLAQQQIDKFISASDPHGPAPELLGQATTRILYDFDCFRTTYQANRDDPSKWQPAFAATLTRETHVSDLAAEPPTKIQIDFSYSDGFGREIQKKVQSESGPLVEGGEDISPRWAGTGWTVFNNKGKPVRQYEPFFSATHAFEFANTVGVSSVLFYDPVERVVATLHPNHTYEKVLFSPWQRDSWDVNDTIRQSDPAADPDIGDLFQHLSTAEYLPTWYAQRASGALGTFEQNAAAKANAHAETPTVEYFDPLGRTFLAVADNGTDGKYLTRILLDIQSNQRAVTDALQRRVMSYDNDMLKNRVHQSSMEAGERWMLNDTAGKPLYSWDSRGHTFRTEYDELRRPTGLFVRGDDTANSDPRTLAGEVLCEKIVYGERQSAPEALNLRTRIFQHYDPAGVVTNTVRNSVTGRDEAYDFKGNLLRASRGIIADCKSLPNWSSPPAVAESFASSTRYDALNRPVELTTPDASVLRLSFNGASLLERVDVNLRGAAAATTFVSNIDYNAKGQRTRIIHGNAGTETDYAYDPLTFRLVKLRTARPNAPADQQVVQDLSYTYDPAGNITHIQDDADIHNAVFFRNQRVDPSCDYTYDAIYRLIAASGREHLGLNGGGTPLPTTPSSYNDFPRVGLLHPGDGHALGTYNEQYEYDAVGNFLHYVHKGANPASPGWTRSYTYNEDSLLESAKKSNRLTSTAISGNQPLNEPYTYDVHGNMISMPQLQAMQWTFKDELRITQRQAVNATDHDGALHQGERTYYTYDAAGQRVRKTTESSAGIKIKERLYLGGFEVYREYDAAGNVTLARETLHVMDDKKRVALVETKVVDSSMPATLLPVTTTRYQFDNHLGTACLELDESADVITYEEYYPYGGTCYQAGRAVAEVSLKRYRYSGKERDAESGLYYHGARYYAPWLGRWTACDPIGLQGGINLYGYVHCSPIVLIDPNGKQAAVSIRPPVVPSAPPLTIVRPPVPVAPVTPPSSAIRPSPINPVTLNYGPSTAIPPSPVVPAPLNYGQSTTTPPPTEVGPFRVDRTGYLEPAWNVPDIDTRGPSPPITVYESLHSTVDRGKTQRRLDQMVHLMWQNNIITDEQRQFYMNTGTLPGITEPTKKNERNFFNEILRAKLQQLMDRLPEDIKASILGWGCLAIGLFVDSEGRFSFQYTVNSNRDHSVIAKEAKKLGITPFKPTPRAGERGVDGAPKDAEQLLIEIDEANDEKLRAVIASRDYCADCAAALTDKHVHMVPFEPVK